MYYTGTRPHKSKTAVDTLLRTGSINCTYRHGMEQRKEPDDDFIISYEKTVGDVTVVILVAAYIDKVH